MPMQIGPGFRFLMDAHQKFWNTGLPVYIRIKNFDDTPDAAAELGFQWAATGAQLTDVRVVPQPAVTDVSLTDIGMNQGQLFFGARRFQISHSFVNSRMVAMGYTDPYQVFRDKTVVGLFYNSRMFRIESITHEELGGETVLWNLVCNALESQITAR